MSSEWYCRTLTNHNRNAEENYSQEDATNYKERYRTLKRKLKFLIYENECFQEALRSTQRQLLKANRDKTYLLDRLLHYDKVDASLTESDDTDSSEDEILKGETFKRKKTDLSTTGESLCHSNITTKSISSRKKKPLLKSMRAMATSSINTNNVHACTLISDGHMTPEEVERHLESRQSYLELVPEKAPPTVPTEMFSNDTSLDKLD